MNSQFKLFRTSRFMPLFLTQFLGAFNDNLFKNALVVLVTYKLADIYNFNAQYLIVVIAALYIVPFFLFSATAGQLADKYEKSRLVKIIKLVEIVLMVLTGFAFQFENLYLLIVLLFLMGAQSTFFGPIKYSILPEHLSNEELVAGNGLIETGTYIAILTGTLCGGLLILHSLGTILIAVGVAGVAIAGYIASLFIPIAVSPLPDLKIDWNIPRATKNIIMSVIPNKPVLRAIIGISWFWFVGAVFFAQLPTFAKNFLGGDETVSTLLLTVFSIGIGIGSIYCNKLLHGKISGWVVPWAAAGVSIATITLYFACSGEVSQGHLVNNLISTEQFLNIPRNWIILGALGAVAASGGVYSVPLYAIMQHKSDEEQRARVVASTNILDSFAMVMSSVLIMLFLSLNITIPQIFLVVGVLNLFMIPFMRYFSK